MKNREKFAEQIIDIAIQRNKIAVNLTSREPCACGKIICSKCLFGESNRDCDVLLKEWAEKEYEEPPVDWSKVPVDTPILVRDHEAMEWIKRYFAKYENGKIYAWGDGTTSWSHDGRATCDWEFAKLAEGAEYD
jgi:hypothetical protein